MRLVKGRNAFSIIKTNENNVITNEWQSEREKLKQSYNDG